MEQQKFTKPFYIFFMMMPARISHAFVDTLRIRNYNGLSLTTHIFEDEDHMSVMPANISRTLKVFYGKKEN
jgi:hypothetical protein